MSNNKIILEGCINTFAELNELDLNQSEVFELFALSQIHKSRNITFENIEQSIVDGSNDGGIDSVMIFIDDEYIENLDNLESFEFSNKTKSKFIITQCKKENSFKESSLDKLITTMPVILDLEKNEEALLSRFNSDLVNQVILLTETWKKTAIGGGQISVDYMYATNAPRVEINNVYEEKVIQLKEVTKACLSSPRIAFYNFSSAELLSLYQKQRVNRLLLEFKDRPLSTDYNNQGIGYIGTVRLSKYKEFLTSESGEIRDDLFESNIRHFQGAVDVNKKIKKTIENITDEDFWWLNNGITIIAENPNEVGKQLSIENIQIVNGLQTSYTIFNNYNSNEDDNRSVLVKVVINNNKATTDNIIASTNSQNPVSATILRATEPIQRNLELFFENKGYYYDRRKNYYKNLGKPSSKIFSIQYAAQSIESIIYNEPHTARASPTSLFKKENTYNKIFNPEKDFKGYLNCCLINKKCHYYWSKYNNSEIKLKTANFKLHLGCTILKEYYQKREVNFNEISNLNIEEINEELFNKTIEFLILVIDSYLEQNPDKNLINIAKSKDFTEYILNQVSIKYL
ncbi:hypothetical protein CRV02_05995 [Arcobacter sp. CECT 8989]|uniref:AIPR family protein n=1 Tax=Arcobacter sp. CECT 8989 TaxID=2044509 RepID=UPI00100A8B26|nr:AIPR family protein [Arcobacter sp. CECT 8989]RXK01866.1 hypothetical protein CRV02_05995 [Arcobacter sp. CECT 8989]